MWELYRDRRAMTTNPETGLTLSFQHSQKSFVMDVRLVEVSHLQMYRTTVLFGAPHYGQMLNCDRARLQSQL